MSDSLCTQCGLCCDGTFFGSVVVVPDEVAQLARVGLPVVHRDGTPALPQPCVALRGCLCSVYVDRPAACARYECELRKKVSAGERDLETALGHVQTMRALLATIRAAFDCPEETSIWERIMALEEPDSAEGAALALRDYGNAIDAVGALLALGRAEFEPRFAGGGSR